MSVEVENLAKHFGDSAEVAAVAGVSFKAPEGHITSLLGPSGSGKSTVLRVVGGLEVPDAGSVRIDGQDVTHVPVRKREVGFVFQSYALFRHMTVFDNVAFGMKIRKRDADEIRARVEELLTLVQLGDYGHRLPDELSGGQRQRIALARALCTRPRVLLLDEPFGALDTKVRAELREWLLRLHDQIPVTTLLVTHDQEEAFELSEHVVLLDSGKVAQAGTPTQIYEEPANAFVASFLGGSNRLRVAGASDAFVRPQDVRVRKADGALARGLVEEKDVAVVERLVRVGAYVKLLVMMPDGHTISVQMPRHEFDDLGIERGGHVFVDMRDVKSFPGGSYSI